MASRIFCEPGLGPDPDTLGARATQRVDGVALEDQVSALETLERKTRVAGLDLVGEVFDPAGDQAEDVVDKPDVVRVEGTLEPGDLFGDVRGGTHVVALTPDRLGAPVAVVRAAARGGHVHRVIAMVGLPDGAVAVDVDQVPGGEGQRVQILQVRTAGVDVELSVTRVGQPEDVLERGAGVVEQDVEKIAQRLLALADQDVVCTSVKIGLGVVCGV